MIKIKVKRVLPKVQQNEPVTPKQESNSKLPSLQEREDLVELLSDLEKQETLEFPANFEGVDQSIDLLMDQKLEFLEFGDPKQPKSLMTIFRLRYLSSSTGDYFEFRPFIEGQPAVAEKFFNSHELKNAIAHRMKAWSKFHPKVKLAEMAKVELKLFGHCW